MFNNKPSNSTSQLHSLNFMGLIKMSTKQSKIKMSEAILFLFKLLPWGFPACLRSHEDEKLKAEIQQGPEAAIVAASKHFSSAHKIGMY